MKKQKTKAIKSKKSSFSMKKTFQEYGSAFKATGASHVYRNRKTIIKSIALCFIPFLYAFIALWAFFDPLGDINRLPIALVNQDISETGNNRVVNLDNLPIKNHTPNKMGAYEFDVDNIEINNKKKTFKIDYFDDSQTFLQHENDVTFLTEILISPTFTSQWQVYLDKVFEILEDGKGDIWNRINDIPNKPEITFQGSFKVSPILGQLNDFALNSLKNTIFSKFFPILVTDKMFDYWKTDAHATDPPDYSNLKPKIMLIYNSLALVIPGMQVHQDAFLDDISTVTDDATWAKSKQVEVDYWKSHGLIDPIKFIDVNVNIIGLDKSPYGFGLGPYFMCIGMWVGGLLLTFNFTRTRDQEKSKFWANYLAKAGWMVIFGLIQATILTTALLILFNNVDLFARFWQLYLFMWFMAICFDLIVQGFAHMFKDHDLGRFIIVIFLVLQLSGSGGTFPVELEPGFFQVITHILPFTYAIRGLRQILIAPDPVAILINMGCMLAIVTVIMSISLFLNWLYDYLDKKRANNPKYQAKKKKYFWSNQKDIVIEESMND